MNLTHYKIVNTYFTWYPGNYAIKQCIANNSNNFEHDHSSSFIVLIITDVQDL